MLVGSTADGAVLWGKAGPPSAGVLGGDMAPPVALLPGVLGADDIVEPDVEDEAEAVPEALPSWPTSDRQPLPADDDGESSGR